MPAITFALPVSLSSGDLLQVFRQQATSQPAYRARGPAGLPEHAVQPRFKSRFFLEPTLSDLPGNGAPSSQADDDSTQKADRGHDERQEKEKPHRPHCAEDIVRRQGVW